MRPVPLYLLPALALACNGATPPPASSGGEAQQAAAQEAKPPAPPPVKRVPLQALSATSGAGAANLLDGKEASTWRPAGDPSDEGVLLRFEAPTTAGSVRLNGCGGATVPGFTAYVDGTLAGGDPSAAAAPTRTLPLFEGASQPIRSLFVKLGGKKGAVCLSEIELLDAAGAPLPIGAPRTASGSVAASSVLTPAAAYHPGYLFDQRTDFGWVEGAKGTGAGESLTLTFNSPQDITALEIWNGYQRSADHFQKNARAKTLTVTAPGAAPQTLAVADTMGVQRLTLGTPLSGTQLTLTLTAATPGSRYEDLVISELRFVDSQGPFTLDTPDMATSEAALQSALGGTALGSLTDTRWVPVCTGEQDAPTQIDGSLKLRTNHSFVFYDQVSDDMDGSVMSEVYDGAWVVTQQSAPWSEIKLYGRRHRIAQSWSPYTGQNTDASTKISGGTVKVAKVKDLGQEATAKLFKEWMKRGVQDNLFACDQLNPTSTAFSKGYAELVDRGAFIVEGTSMIGVYGAARP